MCPLFGRLARTLQITRNPHCRWCHPMKEQEHAPAPPPEPPPTRDLHERRLRPHRMGSTCPIRKTVFVPVSNMKVYAKRTHPWVAVAEGQLVCGYCTSNKVFLTSVSRAGHFRKCAEYQRLMTPRHTSLVEAPSHNCEDISPGPQETLPHLMWECIAIHDPSYSTFGTTPDRLKVPFDTRKLFWFLDAVVTLLPTDCPL